LIDSSRDLDTFHPMDFPINWVIWLTVWFQEVKHHHSIPQLFAQSSLPVDHIMVEDPTEEEIRDFLKKNLIPLLSGKKQSQQSFYDWLWSWGGTPKELIEQESVEGPKSPLEPNVVTAESLENQKIVQELTELKADVVVSIEEPSENLSEEEKIKRNEDLLIESIISTCGCRPRDINRVIRMVKGGRTLEDTLSALLLRAIQDWRNRVLPPFAKHCSYYELMMIVKELCTKDYLSYDQLLYNVFEGDSSKLAKLITNDIIRTVSWRSEGENSVQTQVTTSSHLQLVALRLLMKDKPLRERVVKIVISQETKILHEKAKFLEEELRGLSEMIYRHSKSGTTSVDIQVLLERQKSLLAFLQKILVRQKQVEDLAKWDPEVSESGVQPQSSATTKRRLFFF